MTVTAPNQSAINPSIPNDPPVTAYPRDRKAPSMLRLLHAELTDELRGTWREPAAWFFTLAMPVGFYALFVGLFSEAAGGRAEMGTGTLATLGAFGGMAVASMNPGISLADERQRGWLRVKRTWAVPMPVALAGKALFALPMVILVVVLMTVVGLAMGAVDLSFGRWAALLGAIVLGSVPFLFLGLAIGSKLGPNASVAVLNAIVMPAAIAGGLWMPLEMLPEVMQQIAVVLPSYHLGQLATGVLEGTAVLDHVLALVATAVVTASVAGFAYRRLRV